MVPSDALSRRRALQQAFLKPKLGPVGLFAITKSTACTGRRNPKCWNPLNAANRFGWMRYRITVWIFYLNRRQCSEIETPTRLPTISSAPRHRTLQMRCVLTKADVSGGPGIRGVACPDTEDTCHPCRVTPCSAGCLSSRDPQVPVSVLMATVVGIFVAPAPARF